MTWNIGYAELEDETRAHDKDFRAVAELILRQQPDAVALQELTSLAIGSGSGALIFNVGFSFRDPGLDEAIWFAPGS